MCLEINLSSKFKKFYQSLKRKIWRGPNHGRHGKGKIKLSFSFGKIKAISNVLCVPNLSKKLLSIGMIINKGNIMVFDSKKCLVINNGDPNIIVAKGVKDQKNGLYRLQVHFVKCSTSQRAKSICRKRCRNRRCTSNYVLALKDGAIALPNSLHFEF